MPHVKLSLALLMTCLCAGCMVGPNYHPPEQDIADSWISIEETNTGQIDDQEPYTCWWELFQDPLLNRYIELALCYNNSLIAAEANILQARAIKVVAAAPLFPQLGADFNATHYYFSKNGPMFSLGSSGPGIDTATAAPGNAFQTQIPQTQNLYNALLDAKWEIDLFGKTRRKVEAAEANIDIAIEQRNDVLVSILAEVARNYIEIRSAQKKILLIEKNINLLTKTNEITQRKFSSGLSNNLDVNRIEAELLNARSAIPSLLALIDRDIYALATLVGCLPECIISEMLPQQPLPQSPSCLSVGIRSDLLRRRPDVRRAERQLAYATAEIGVAVAAFFPSITLSGSDGFQSLHLSNLFQGGSKTWSYGIDVNMPIFRGGSLVGNLKANKAATASAAFNYQNIVLHAIQETEGAIATYVRDLDTVEILKLSTAKTTQVSHLMNVRYNQGLVNLTDWLDSERQLINSELNLLDSETSVLFDIIFLYKALGGSCF